MDSEVPTLLVRVTNIGRRPIQVLNLVKRGKTQTWSSPLRLPDMTVRGIDPISQLEEIHEKMLAHNIAIKLNEGETLDLSFTLEDRSRFFWVQDDPPTEAQELFIEDVAGNRHPIKGSKQNLRVLLDFPSQNASQETPTK